MSSQLLLAIRKMPLYHVCNRKRTEIFNGRNYVTHCGIVARKDEVREQEGHVPEEKVCCNCQYAWTAARRREAKAEAQRA
jgi:hypothetical protein